MGEASSSIKVTPVYEWAAKKGQRKKEIKEKKKVYRRDRKKHIER
jgi:hypothetical protein